MLHLPFWRLHYQLVWATKDRSPLINPSRESIIHKTIAEKTHELHLWLHAIGGVEDHLHVVASIPPALSVAECVKHLKGASARVVNRSEAAGKVFGWQEGYGALTVEERSLPRVVAYVKNQREHHAARTTVSLYEQSTEEG